MAFAADGDHDDAFIGGRRVGIGGSADISARVLVLRPATAGVKREHIACASQNAAFYALPRAQRRTVLASLVRYSLCDPADPSILPPVNN